MTTLTLKTYNEQTSQFAVFPAEVRQDYVWLGLANEYGEFLGKYKKILRGDKTLEDSYPLLQDELGDCFWYLSEYISTYNVNVNTIEIFDELAHNLSISSLIQLFQDCFILIGKLTNLIEEDYDRSDLRYTIEEQRRRVIVLCSIYGCFCEMARRFDTTPEAVMQMNLDKLTDRKNRDVIKGSGDSR